MWQYLARNFKADVIFLSPIKLVSLRKLAPSRNAVFNQTGMDFVTGHGLYLSVKPRLLMRKGWFLEDKSQLGKSFKTSV